jgi:hypothetical protein
VLPFAARRGFNFDPGELAIQAVEDAEDERDDEASSEMAGRKTDCPENPKQKTEHRDLIGRNARPAETGDDECFHRRVCVGR